MRCVLHFMFVSFWFAVAGFAATIFYVSWSVNFEEALCSWYPESCRRWAFKSVNQTLPQCAFLATIVATTMGILAGKRRHKEMIAVASGNVITTLLYVSTEKFDDPAWATLFAINSIGIAMSLFCAFCATIYLGVRTKLRSWTAKTNGTPTNPVR